MTSPKGTVGHLVYKECVQSKLLIKTGQMCVVTSDHKPHYIVLKTWKFTKLILNLFKILDNDFSQCYLWKNFPPFNYDWYLITFILFKGHSTEWVPFPCCYSKKIKLILTIHYDAHSILKQVPKNVFKSWPKKPVDHNLTDLRMCFTCIRDDARGQVTLGLQHTPFANNFRTLPLNLCGCGSSESHLLTEREELCIKALYSSEFVLSCAQAADIPVYLFSMG